MEKSCESKVAPWKGWSIVQSYIHRLEECLQLSSFYVLNQICVRRQIRYLKSGTSCQVPNRWWGFFYKIDLRDRNVSEQCGKNNLLEGSGYKSKKKGGTCADGAMYATHELAPLVATLTCSLMEKKRLSKEEIRLQRHALEGGRYLSSTISTECIKFVKH